MTTVSTELTDAECDAFRALPLDFNGMVRAIYAAGAARSADTSGARWVSVDERMPDTDDEVLVWVTSPWAKTAYSMVDSWYLHREDPTGMGGPTLEMGYLWRENDAEDVTHWMSLPEPPPAAPGGPAGARRPDENSPSGPSDRALNPQPEAVDHDRGA